MLENNEKDLVSECRKNNLPQEKCEDKSTHVEYNIVIGLEVHVELRTATKIFCGCSTRFGAAPNTLCCPICTGQPGTLPRLNRKVVEHGIAAGLVLECEIRRETHMDRKNYFYPDLPKSYQISQLYAPICYNGRVECKRADGSDFTVRIHELHMEEDAGKLVHSEDGRRSLVDYNRCGVPLLEIVSEPDMANADEVIAYLTELRNRLLFAGISDCRMQEGSMRVDVNLSVHKSDEPLGTRTEMKNLGSFRSIRKAIEVESARQIATLREGGKVVQETRRFDETSEQSLSMRSKENAADYRYFPEPDIPTIYISDEWIAEVKESLPTSRREREQFYIAKYGLTEYDARQLTETPELADFYESTIVEGAEPKEASNFIQTELLRYWQDGDVFPVSAEHLAELLCLVQEKIINRTTAKEIFAALLEGDFSPRQYVAEHGLGLVSDEGSLRAVIEEVLTANPASVQDYLGGKERAIGYLIGQAMKALGGRGQADKIREMLREALEEKRV